jgi:23S rRNA (cytosine1962-C5)-methyltransferase
MQTWKIKRDSEKRIRTGHPWVFSNDLMKSPKGIEAGELIELHTERGEVLGTGYGHPGSLISFRFLTRERLDDVGTAEFFFRSIRKSWQHRLQLGFDNVSFRLVFAEADGLPGLIIDRYVLQTYGEPEQIFVIQISTSGMENLKDSVVAGLEKAVKYFSELKHSPNWSQTGVILSPDSGIRALEGLKVEAKSWLKPSLVEKQNGKVEIQIRSARKKEVGPTMNVDLIEGQKTGFFLDQAYNISLLTEIFDTWIHTQKRRPIRVLDLFTYVGQWSAQLVKDAPIDPSQFEVTLADASDDALAMAQANVEKTGAKVKTVKMDILEKLSQLNSEPFDVVICDPPAFVKKKKDLPTAVPAYVKLNRDAMRLTRKGGLFVSCSCSGLLDSNEFRQVLMKASHKAEQDFTWVAQGGLAWDHPMRIEFPEGQYLKGWVGITKEFQL